MTRTAFTLIEIMATLLLMAFGLVSVIGLVEYAGRLSAEAQSQDTAMLTAETALHDYAPLGLIADTGDANGDGWQVDTDPAAELTKPRYTFQARGWLNGYYVLREERSEATDILAGGGLRYAWVTVDVYGGDRLVANLRRRLLRRMESP